MRGFPCLVVLLAVWSCSSPSEHDVQAEFNAFVERHNACTADDECAIVSPGCPLGCSVAVNQSSVDATNAKARDLIDQYESGGRACDYGCLAPGTPQCEAGHCQIATTSETDAGGTGCTLIGCGPAFQVDFEKASSWSSGTYRVVLALDAQTVICNASLPLSCDAPFPCDDPDVLLLLEGCALPSAEQALGGIAITLGTPTNVSITVEHDGQVIAQGQWTPQYQTTRPNGAMCEPECNSAPAETLAVP